MPGLFDLFSGNDPMKQQSLLAAAAAILQASGPSRTPTSFGQVLGGGLGAYQDSLEHQQQLAQRTRALDQNYQLNDLTIQDKQSDLANQKSNRQRAEDLLKFSGEYWKKGGTSQPAAPFSGGQSAAGMMHGLVSGADPPA